MNRTFGSAPMIAVIAVVVSALVGAIASTTMTSEAGGAQEALTVAATSTSSALPTAQPATVATGPSPWLGPKLKHPSGGKFPKRVLRWANLTLAVMAEQNIPSKFLPGILAQIQQESDGNPRSTNLTDSNAAAGDPSKGLLQIIGDTYVTHSKPGFKNRKYQAVPYTNIWASLAYVRSQYGMSKFDRWNAGLNHAY